MKLRTYPINAITTAIAIAITMAFFVIAMYFFQFHGGLSANSQRWSDFGSYVGGTLSPLFAFLAFSLGIYTLNQSRQQIRRDELLKTINGYEQDFERYIAKPVSCEDPWIWGNDLGAAGEVKEVPLRTLLKSDGIDWEQYLPIVAQGLKFRVLSDGELIQDRDIWLGAHLAVEGIFRYMAIYQSAGGDTSLVLYFTEKYEIARNRLLFSSCAGQA